MPNAYTLYPIPYTLYPIPYTLFAIADCRLPIARRCAFASRERTSPLHPTPYILSFPQLTRVRIVNVDRDPANSPVMAS